MQRSLGVANFCRRTSRTPIAPTDPHAHTVVSLGGGQGRVLLFHTVVQGRAEYVSGSILLTE